MVEGELHATKQDRIGWERWRGVPHQVRALTVDEWLAFEENPYRQWRDYDAPSSAPAAGSSNDDAGEEYDQGNWNDLVGGRWLRRSLLPDGTPVYRLTDPELRERRRRILREGVIGVLQYTRSPTGFHRLSITPRRGVVHLTTLAYYKRQRRRGFLPHITLAYERKIRKAPRYQRAGIREALEI